ncbi:MAG: cysteine--tRNA ligase [Candidatus Omnitrophica bacterium]|nr:cysteine--tRNA ligase [Candidatus Omnitrophota bacterium]
MKIYNTLTRKKQEFKPQKNQEIKMYTCGVTVYDDCHIGHARSLYIFEVIRKYLKYRGFKVDFIRNITDIDDKIINKARQWSKDKNISLEEGFEEVRKTYIDSYYQDLESLKIPKADIEPKATENIPEMIKFAQGLIAKDIAYEKQGNVYFSVRKFKDYGKLSGKKIDDLLSSVRIEEDPLKEDPLDFALWKAAKENEPSWQSPWGKGRPGWHIECSVMSQKYLKTDTLDIHGGGRDLVFPHHENEIAQSEALTGKPFANFWIHHGLLTINGQKMAKSLGNFYTIKDVINKYPADILKIFYLQAHYSSPVDFSWEKMEEAKSAYERIYLLVNKLKKMSLPACETKIGGIEEIRAQFQESMDDDFNTPKALAVLFELVNMTNKLLETEDSQSEIKLGKIVNLMTVITDVFGFTFPEIDSGSMDNEKISELINLRLKLRKEKKFAEADKIRKELENKGVILEDTKDGTEWRRKL